MPIGREFQGYYANQACYKSAIIFPEYFVQCHLVALKETACPAFRQQCSVLRLFVVRRYYLAMLEYASGLTYWPLNIDCAEPGYNLPIRYLHRCRQETLTVLQF